MPISLFEDIKIFKKKILFILATYSGLSFLLDLGSCKEDSTSGSVMFQVTAYQHKTEVNTSLLSFRSVTPENCELEVSPLPI